jgi:hypothetical protein
MNEETPKGVRLRIMSELAKRSQGGMGRTTLMKLIYFLQTLKGLPLGYRFRLYTYGPFDPKVLDDLKMAEMSGIVRSSVSSYSGGYGYEIRPADVGIRASFGGFRRTGESRVCDRSEHGIMRRSTGLGRRRVRLPGRGRPRNGKHDRLPGSSGRGDPRATIHT